MRNIVLCFDDDRARNVSALIDLIDHTDSQIAWRGSGFGRSLAEAYLFVLNSWRPGDRIYLFGAGRSAYCARALARLLGTVGVVRHNSDGLLEYILHTHTRAVTQRTPADWARLAYLTWYLCGRDSSVPVEFLGLWDTLKPHGLPKVSRHDVEPLPNVVAGRHAVAIDNRNRYLVSRQAAKWIDEVWFRGGHADVAGGGRRELADITLDWMLDGARRAGLQLRTDVRDKVPAPTEMDALCTGRRTPAMSALGGVRSRTLPDKAQAHASVDVYLRAHPAYWRRLPRTVTWADSGWPARSERLVEAASTPLVRPMPTVPVARHALAAAAS
jgi:uncharacterized protein (DUF2235 family)